MMPTASKKGRRLQGVMRTSRLDFCTMLRYFERVHTWLHTRIGRGTMIDDRIGVPGARGTLQELERVWLADGQLILGF